MARVIVIVDGGVVQQIVSDKPVEVAVIDYDAEMYDEHQLIDLEGDKVHAFKQTPIVEQKRVADLWGQI